MSLYKIADFIFDIKNKYSYSARLMADYKCSCDLPSDFSVEIPESEIDISLKKEPSSGPGYHESLCILRHICSLLSKSDCFLMHSSVVRLNGMGYCFTAQSGTGKTTHSLLWKEAFPGAEIINGDKPIFKYEDSSFYAYGTPFCGKEGFNVNTRVKILAVAFLHQSPENSIRKMTVPEILSQVFEQVYLPQDKSEKEAVLSLLDKFISQVPFYSLGCNITKEAAVLAHKTMSESEEKNEN